MWTVVDYENIDLSGTTAVGFTASKLTPSDPPPQAALCQVGTAQVLHSLNNVGPTLGALSSGKLSYPFGKFIITGLPDLRSFRVVKFGDRNSSLYIEYLR